MRDLQRHKHAGASYEVCRRRYSEIGNENMQRGRNICKIARMLVQEVWHRGGTPPGVIIQFTPLHYYIRCSDHKIYENIAILTDSEHQLQERMLSWQTNMVRFEPMMISKTDISVVEKMDRG